MSYWIIVKHGDRHAKVKKLDFSNEFFQEILVEYSKTDKTFISWEVFRKEVEIIGIVREGA